MDSLSAGIGAPSPRHRGSALAVALAATAMICAAAALVGASSSAKAAAPGQFGSEGTGAGQFVEPRGIAVEQQSGEVYLADRNNQRIERFSSEGDFELAWGWGVADGTSHEAQSCGPSAAPPRVTCFGGFEGSGAGQFEFPSGVAVDNDLASPSHGDVYVVDVRNQRVEKFGPGGNFILMFGGGVNAVTSADICLAGETCQAGSDGTGDGEFHGLGNTAIAVGPDGSVYVGDENRVQKFSPGGAWESQLVLSGGLVENTVLTLAVDSEANLYVGAAQQSGIHKYAPSGVELGTPRDQAGRVEFFAIAIGPGNELFVNEAQGSGRHILSFDAAGDQTASFDPGANIQDGRFGIAYGDTVGLLYVIRPEAVRLVPPPAAGPLIVPVSETAGVIGTRTATLGALLNPEGATTGYHFEYGTTAAYGTSVPIPDGALAAGFEDESISVPLSGLAPGTLYHYRLVAGNVNATVEGPDQTFETLPPVSIDASSASAVSASGATLEAELNPHGLPGEYRFEYGQSTAYGRATPIPDGSLGAGSNDVIRTAVLQGLEPGTTYHYRVVAHSVLGTVIGADHVFTTQGFVASVLPDGRAWELVTPPDKYGSPLEAISNEGGVIQASAKGTGITYVALGPIVANPLGNRTRSYSQDLSERHPDGWSTEDITTPHETVAILAAGFTGEYRAFSEELGSGAVEPQGATPLSPFATERTPYSREADGTYAPFVTPANVAEGVKFGGVESSDTLGSFAEGVEFVSATPDLKHVVLGSPQPLTGGPPAGGVGSLFEWTAGELQLVSVLPDGEPAAANGQSTSLGAKEFNMRSAISENGNRVIFETADAPRHLYVRDMALGQTALVDAAGEGLSTGPFRPEFQGASLDGNRIFFTDEAKLTSDSTAAPGSADLYMCEVKVSGGVLSCAITDLTVDPTPGESSAVQGFALGVDDAGEHVFFVANGVLTTTPSARGEVAAPGDCSGEGERCNLYMYDTGTHETTLIAVLSGADAPDWAHAVVHELGNLTARVSGNGRYLAFMSDRSLTGYDNRDRVSGARDQEVFRYDSVENALTCVSCNPTGARPLGVFDEGSFPGLLVDRPNSWGGQTIAGSIPGWTLRSVLKATYQSRYLSNSGRMFFNAADALVPGDSNGLEDVYEFESPQGPGQPASDNCTAASPAYSPVSEGCVSLISSGTSNEESAFLDASESGDDVFFLTAAKLAAGDTDTAADVYDAHVCSTGSPCPPTPAAPSPACAGDACQQPASPPAHPTPGTLLLDGPGNVVQCAKGKVKKGGKCVKKQQKKAKKHKKHKHKKSSGKKGSGKKQKRANSKREAHK